MQERTKPVMFSAEGYGQGMEDWITFDDLYDYRGGGFDLSSGTYTVPEDGIYLFGLKAKSGSQLDWTQIILSLNDIEAQTVVTDGNEKDYWNNLGTTWTYTLTKGDKLRLKVFRGTVDGIFRWWGVRIIAE